MLYFKKFSQKYDKLAQKNKNIILILSYFVVLLLLAQYLLFASIDSYNASFIAREEQASEGVRLQAQKQELLLIAAKNSQNNLIKQKSDLTEEVNTLLINNKGVSYVNSQRVPEIMGKILSKINTLNLVEIKNMPIKESVNGSILIEHHFVLSVKGSYQAMYQLLKELEIANVVHVSSIEMKKQDATLLVNIDFYIINTNKEIINF